MENNQYGKQTFNKPFNFFKQETLLNLYSPQLTNGLHPPPTERVNTLIHLK